jgi:hypothetical protein
MEVALGYVEEPDGSVLVAAGSPDVAWARNLDVDPRCSVVVRGTAWPEAIAEPLDDLDAQRTVRELILRYGTPAERLGRGPAYRLSPVAPG